MSYYHDNMLPSYCKHNTKVKEMPTPEEITQVLELLTVNRKTLSIYLKQQAVLGGTGYSSPGIVHGIEECRNNIRKIKSTLRKWDVKFEDLPYDDTDDYNDIISPEIEVQVSPNVALEASTKSKTTTDRLRDLKPHKKSSLGAKINKTSLQWSLKHLIRFGDTDLFPRPIEFDALHEIEAETVRRLRDIDAIDYIYSPARRFIVPKDELSYRTATQLDPVDTIILTAIIRQYGELIEKRRTPVAENKVFGYRFMPQSDGTLYNPKISWIDFWNKCKDEILNYRYAVYLDIADFYNQIYHENVENQLMRSGFPEQIKNWLMGLLGSVTARIPRGIPVGPHATHILGELSLIPIDNSLSARGLDFCRFVDDIVIFCDEYEEAKIIIYQIANVLDNQQRLILQRHKTKIFNASEFETYCRNMLQDRPINKFEEDILAIIRTHSEVSPYKSIDISTLTKRELNVFTQDLVENILTEYLKEKEPNYTRLRWFLRRLSQFGVPSAVEFCIKHIDELTPAIGDVCHYLISAGNNYKGDWKTLGAGIFDILQGGIMRSNEYFQISLLSLFSRNSSMDNVSKLITLYQSSAPNLRREILLSAYRLDVGDWIRELKESFSGLDPWSKRAFIIASKSLPYEERASFLDHMRDGIVLNELLVNWAKMRP
jgi:Reverse transcriptase (RNA-dependent DNA polymerase)